MAKIHNPNIGGKFKPIARADIVEAQKHTKSNLAAAKYLGVPYPRYRKYAKIYNLFDQHLNPKGIGVAKGYAKKPSTVSLKDIFANKHPKYNLVRLRNRLIARGLLADRCDMCGFDEKRITDGKCPIMITFKDGTKNFALDNLQLLCYNCVFLTTGAPSVANRGLIEKSFKEPEKIPKSWQVEPRDVDSIDPEEPDVTPSGPDRFDDIKNEILDELDR